MSAKGTKLARLAERVEELEHQKAAAVAGVHAAEVVLAGASDRIAKIEAENERLRDRLAFMDAQELRLQDAARASKREAEAAALLMREVLCERVYRGRAGWDPEHPCRALALRGISPDLVARNARTGMLELTSADLRAVASMLLDLIEDNEAPRG